MLVFVCFYHLYCIIISLVIPLKTVAKSATKALHVRWGEYRSVISNQLAVSEFYYSLLSVNFEL
jgi:hypothetical protein